MINRPDRPIARDGDDRDRQAILRERGEGAHAEQDALTDPDAVAGAYDVTDPDELRDIEVHRPADPVEIIDVTDPDDVHEVADPDEIRDVTDPDGERIVPDPDEDRATGH